MKKRNQWMHIMPIQKKSYDDTAAYTGKKNPLMIGCSGGRGHITAIQGVRNYLKENYGENNINFTKYAPVLHAQKRASWTRTHIDVGAVAMNDLYVLSPTLKTILSFTSLPLLPDSGSLHDELSALNEKETNIKEREYIDMLLDVYPAGYESASIWNVLQRTDKTAQLKKLINMQRSTDQENYADVCRDVLELLNDAAVNPTPYTEIISTQAMGLPALCDTVKQYNESHPDKPIVIHQYMTDLPTKGAVHFFNALSTLTPEQQKQMKLYGVGMTKDILDQFFPQSQHFCGVYDIPADNNPMVRAGFKNNTLDNTQKFHVNVTISLTDSQHVINKHEQIASIMLGSQASHDTVKYIETLLENGMDNVFVFGGENDAISKEIDAILTAHPKYKDKIIRLGNQGDKEIASLMTRSNMVIIRGGGLSVMEQMAMPHNRHQTILIHHANSPAHELTSGISWEDDNVAALIADLKQKNVHIEKTSPERAKRQIAEARLIAVAKREFDSCTVDEITRYVKDLQPQKLSQYVAALQQSGDEKTQHFFEYLTEYKAHEIREQNNRETKIKLVIDSLITECRGCMDYLNTLLTKPSIDVEQTQASLTAVKTLFAILTDTSTTLSSEKLEHFKNEYEQPATKKALFYSHDNVIMRFVREINYQLAKIYILNYMLGLDKFFTPSQKIRKQMETNKPDETNPFSHS